MTYASKEIATSPETAGASSSNFLTNNFDLVRLFAALQTVLEHSVFFILFCRHDWEGLPLVLRHILDFHGVAIFFVISGYLVSASWERTPSLYAYARNRILRIYPALWVCLLFSIALIFILRIQFTAGEFLQWFAAQATILQCYNPEFFRNHGFGLITPGKGVINGALWTITIELQFYVAFPILYTLLKKLRRGLESNGLTAIIATAAFAFLGWLITQYGGIFFPKHFPFNPFLFFTFIPHFYLFLFGWAVRKNFHWLAPILRGKALLWILGICLLVYLREAYGYFPALRGRMGVFSIQYILLGFTAISCAYTFPTLAKKLLRGNDISYGVYIWHMLIITVFLEMGLFGWLEYKFLYLLLSTTILFATLSWLLIERPVLRLKRAPLRKTNPH